MGFGYYCIYSDPSLPFLFKVICVILFTMEDKTSVQTFTPQVTEEHKPKVGKEFETIKGAYELYNKYAREAGFSAKLSNIECTGERHRGIVRVSCKAKLTMTKSKSSPNWIVSRFVESHNHALATPSKVPLLRSHRHVSNAKKALAKQFFEANVSTSQQISLMEIGYGSPQKYWMYRARYQKL
ncbi:protein FAR1-RELATED SEQUENCE 5-like [Olea europaea var. sylvestris]|uniref:protein FAR1-RELATED SEQUENCE 5-like n=1 Tax=Olea europaea var. sylvestris TaxID=158386 RepID=UPI000C1D8B46|nr:protein FAR1-RELATED SEQUENCE 5-like [Olea europaea var. sylvestris]